MHSFLDVRTAAAGVKETQWIRSAKIKVEISKQPMPYEELSIDKYGDILPSDSSTSAAPGTVKAGTW